MAIETPLFQLNSLFYIALQHNVRYVVKLFFEKRREKYAMYKATEILSLPIRDIKEGEYCGQAKNILFGAKKGQYYLELDKRCLGQAAVIDKEDIAGIGCDFILIEQKSDIQKVLSADEVLRSSLKRSYVLLGVEVVDEAGWRLGKIVDLAIDEEGTLSNIVLDCGATIEKDEIISVCSDVIFVKDKKEPKEYATEKIDGEPAEESEVLGEDTNNSKKLNEYEIEPEDENLQSPIGLNASEDVVSADGLFEIKKGDVITKEIFEKAKEHDAVLALGFVAK